MGDVRDAQTEVQEGRRLGEACHPYCVVCSARNPRGLDLRFRPLPGGTAVVAELRCEPAIEGYPGLVHGGIVCAVLDAAMANCLFHAGVPGHTARFNARFHQPVFADRLATVSARLVRSRGRVAELVGELAQDGHVKVTASARFVTERPATSGRAIDDACAGHERGHHGDH